MELRDSRYNTIRLTFEEGPHKYTDNFGNEYLSMTTLLHNYEPKFDEAYWLRKKSKEYNMSEKKLKALWTTIKDEACERGSKTHNGLEDSIKEASKFAKAIEYLTDRKDGVMTTVADIPLFNAKQKLLDIDEFIERTENRYKPIYDAFRRYTENGYKIYSEIGVFNMDYLISGTIDILLIREDKFIIGDWKTNRGGLKFTSGYYKKDKTQKPQQLTDIWVENNETLLPPVNNLPKCNGSIYNLQTTGYGYLTELILDIPCGGCWLCHIDNDFILNEYNQPKLFYDGYHLKDNPVEKISFYNMPYRKAEFAAILADRKLRLDATKINTQYSLL